MTTLPEHAAEYASNVADTECELKHLRVTLACVLEQQRYRPGDQAPDGYLAWHEWAEVQHKAGLRQKQCGRCGLWRYPQQLSALVDSTEVTGLRKRQPFRRTLETPVCNDCAEKQP